VVVRYPSSNNREAVKTGTARLGDGYLQLSAAWAFFKASHNHPERRWSLSQQVTEAVVSRLLFCFKRSTPVVSVLVYLSIPVERGANSPRKASRGGPL